MAINLTTTRKANDGVKVLVYGDSGVGKTLLIETAPKPVIISAEKGLLTLKHTNIPVIEVSSYQDLEDAYDFVTTNEKAKKFQTICLDSITDIAQTILDEEKKAAGKDPRKAYGGYADKLIPLIKKFRDIKGKHVYFTAQLKRTADEFSGIDKFGPSMPGRQLGPALPYMFDFCFAMRIGEDAETEESFRYLQTQPDVQYIAKERGDALDDIEVADLSVIFEKAMSTAPHKKKKKPAKKKVEPVGDQNLSEDQVEVAPEEKHEVKYDGDFEPDEDVAEEVAEEGESESEAMTICPGCGEIPIEEFVDNTCPSCELVIPEETVTEDTVAEEK